MHPAPSNNLLNTINVANVTDSLNIKDSFNLLNDTAILSGINLLNGSLNGNSILEGGIGNGNDVNVSPSIDIGNVDANLIKSLDVLSGDINASHLVGDVLANSGSIGNVVQAPISDAVDILSGNSAPGIVASVTDTLDAANVAQSNIGDIASNFGGIDALTDVADLSHLNISDVALVNQILAPITGNALDASDLTGIKIGDVGTDLVDAVAGLKDFNVLNAASEVGDVTAAVSGLAAHFDEVNVGGLISNLAQFDDVSNIAGAVDLGDVGALIGPQVIGEVGLADLQALVTEIDLFNVVELSHDH